MRHSHGQWESVVQVRATDFLRLLDGCLKKANVLLSVLLSSLYFGQSLRFVNSDPGFLLSPQFMTVSAAKQNRL
jgi:hypothetical protein